MGKTQYNNLTHIYIPFFTSKPMKTEDFNLYFLSPLLVNKEIKTEDFMLLFKNLT